MSKKKGEKLTRGNSYYRAGFSGSYSSWEPECHTGTIAVFTAPLGGKTVEFCGGGKTRDLDLGGVDLYIDLTGSPSTKSSPVRVNERAAKWFEHLEDLATIPTISIDWPDYSTPPLSRSFWEELLKAIAAFAKDCPHDPVRVVFACQGGHGRTGTALAIVAALTGATKDDPVKFVRKNYCKRAIESTTQIEYIEQITGLKVKEQPRLGYGYGGYYYETDKGHSPVEKKDKNNVQKILDDTKGLIQLSPPYIGRCSVCGKNTEVAPFGYDTEGTFLLNACEKCAEKHGLRWDKEILCEMCYSVDGVSYDAREMMYLCRECRKYRDQNPYTFGLYDYD